jgi:hypothetical protein
MRLSIFFVMVATVVLLGFKGAAPAEAKTFCSTCDSVLTYCGGHARTEKCQSEWVRCRRTCARPF